MAIRQFNSVAGFSVGDTQVTVIDANANITANALAITGNVSGDNIVVNNNGNITGANVIIATTMLADSIGNASSVLFGNGTNITGEVALANTVGNPAQPNITSVGTLVDLSVTGNVTANNYSGNTATYNLSVTAPTFVGNLSTIASPNAETIVVGALPVISPPTPGDFNGTTRTVTTEAELTAAITASVAGDIIDVSGTITVTATVAINKRLKFTGTGTIRTAGAGSDPVTVLNITADGVWLDDNLTITHSKTTNTSVETAITVNALNFVSGAEVNFVEFGYILRGSFTITGVVTQYVGALGNNHRHISIFKLSAPSEISNVQYDFPEEATPRASFIFVGSSSASDTFDSTLIVKNTSQIDPTKRQRQFYLHESLVGTGGSLIFYNNQFNDLNGGIGFISSTIAPLDFINPLTIVNNTQGNAAAGNYKGMVFFDGTNATPLRSYGNGIVYSLNNVTTAGALRPDYTAVLDTNTIAVKAATYDASVKIIPQNSNSYNTAIDFLYEFVGDNTYGNSNVAAYLASNTNVVITTIGNITTTANISGAFINGDGGLLSNIAAANVVGTVANAINAATVTDAAQGNITSVGTLDSLAVSGITDLVDLNASGAVVLNGVTITEQSLTTTGFGFEISGTDQGVQLQSLDTANSTFALVFADNTGAGLVTDAGEIIVGIDGNVTVTDSMSVGGELSTTGNISTNGDITVDGNVITTNILGINAGSGVTITATGTDQNITLVPSGAGTIAASNARITGLANPVDPQDAATKQYVDDVAQGLSIRGASQVATTADLGATYDNGTDGVGATLTINTGPATIDGVTLVAGTQRILVKNQTNLFENGIYVVTSQNVGVQTVLTRTADFDTPADMTGGAYTFVQDGDINNNTGWVQIDPVTTVGTSAVEFDQFSGAGTYTAGTGLTLTGTQFNISNTAVTSGTYGNASQTVTFTVNAQGQLIAASQQAVVANAETLTGTSLAATVVGSSLTSVGALTTLTVSGNASAGNLTTTGNVEGGNVNATVGVSAQTLLATEAVLVKLSAIQSGNVTTTATTQVTLFTGTTNKSYELLIKGRATAGGSESVSKVLATTQGDYIVYGETISGTTPGAIAVTSTGNIVTVLVTPASTDETLWVCQAYAV
jgi:hypothetical protein